MVNLDLCDLPNDISQQYLPYTTTLRQRQKAHAFSRNGYVHKVKLSRNENDVIDISAKVYRSQRKSETPHNINMTVNSCTKTITEGFCSCKSGISGECAHILAVLMTLQNWILDGYKEVPAEQSCTSLPQSWDKPRGSKIHPEPVSQMVICKPVNVSRKRKPLMAAFYDNRIKKQVDRDDIAYLQSLADIPIAYLASDPGTTLNTAYGSQYIGCGLGYHVTRSTWTRWAAIFFVIATSAAGICPSHGAFGGITSLKPNISISSLILKPLSTITPSPSLSMPQSIIFLIVSNNPLCEDIALSDIAPENNMEINVTDPRGSTPIKPLTAPLMNPVSVPSGQVNPCGDLTFSLDINIDLPSIITDNSDYWTELEVNKDQCFDIEKNTRTQSNCELWHNLRKNRLTASCFGKIVKRKMVVSDKFLQSLFKPKKFVQGQLLLTGSPFCDFVTYTRKDLKVQRIFPNQDTFEKLLEKLANFYVNHAVPFLNADGNS
ncbi:hypothetical protein KUTeg_021464 [Tegillarca granosa]|uniref:SWIM-type domain-containing protein n=1 Tax=Tegillarca granosa TaxID=220873 RepID=A0ABQ9E481_TEGGR|nr:hypothetical protein KUTeg_021464 [Tegillarca granosa]